MYDIAVDTSESSPLSFMMRLKLNQVNPYCSSFCSCSYFTYNFKYNVPIYFWFHSTCTSALSLLCIYHTNESPSPRCCVMWRTSFDRCNGSKTLSKSAQQVKVRKCSYLIISRERICNMSRTVGQSVGQLVPVVISFGALVTGIGTGLGSRV